MSYNMADSSSEQLRQVGIIMDNIKSTYHAPRAQPPLLTSHKQKSKKAITFSQSDILVVIENSV
jgi:hypothetical protein